MSTAPQLELLPLVRAALTERQAQVCELLLQGYSTPEMAKELKISQQAIKHRFDDLRRRFKIHGDSNRIGIVRALVH